MSTDVLVSKTEAVQNLYALFGQGKIPEMMDLFSDDIAWDATRNPYIPTPKVYNGKPELLQFFQSVGETMNISVFDPQNFFERGNTLFVNGHFELELKKNNRPVKIDWTMRWKFRDGKVYSFAEYFAPED